jgi:diguanylate cyclase (GGDEF)-like protein/PAS domain S-box-containing protein
VLLSDGTLATVALAMAAILVKPRIRARLRAEPTVAQRAITELGSTVFCFIGANGVIRSITPNAREVLGDACDRAAELELTFADLIQPESRVRVDDWVCRAWQPEPAPPLTIATRGPTSGRRWLELSTPGRIRLAQGEAVLVEIREITDHAERQNHARLLARALDSGADPVFITDLDGRLVYVNAAFERVLGYRSAEVLGRPASLLSSGHHRPEFFARLWQTIAAGQPFTGEVSNRRADGSLCTMDVMITRLDGDAATPPRYVTVARDITSRRQVEREVEDHAFYDVLTGLANHRLLRERARQVLALTRRHGSTTALLHIDLERLGVVNARHGRATGDEVLRHIAERLQLALRESDTLARLGGDEFLVMLSEITDDAAIARVVRRLLDCVSQPVSIRGIEIPISCTIGVALYPRDASTFDDLVAAAEVALRRAERASSPFEFFEHSVSAASHDRLMLEEDLHWAWDHDQFILHYQPIVATSGEIVGAEALARNDAVGMEALARWPHMERGLLEPAVFIPLAERTGRILSLDRWAMATAARQGAQWQQQGWKGWVSVNVSARTLQDPELPDYVERTLRAHELEAERFVIEITESAAMRDPAQTARVLESLRNSGVRIALDDFGVGHSSLAYLKLFPVDLLKLDRCFINGIGRSRREEQLIEIMISLAHRIGARVVAEGVEEVTQMRWLERAGCDYVQGYLTGRPAPADTVPAASRAAL